jgi:hypothetical protein
MMHCGFEPTAVTDTVAHPLKALKVAVLGPRTSGPMAPELPRRYELPADAGGGIAVSLQPLGGGKPGR